MRKWFIFTSLAALLAYSLGWALEGYASDPATQSNVSVAERVVAVGDIACPPYGDEKESEEPFELPGLQTCQQVATAKVAQAFDPSLLLLLGDIQYPYGSLKDFKGGFDKSWGMFGDKLKPAPGNHDYSTPGGPGYYSYFGQRAGQRGKGYYSFDLSQGWHIISLDTNCWWSEKGRCGPTTAQYKWLEADLQAHPLQCTLAFWHHPVFDSGAFRTWDDQRAPGRQFFDLLYRHGADLVLNGHDHLYERFAHMNPNGKADALGVRQIIVGTGGRNLQQSYKRAAGSEFIDNKHFGVLDLNLGPGGYTWEFVDTKGRTLDRGYDRCHMP